MKTIKRLQERVDRRPAGGLIQAACDIGLSSAWACGHPGCSSVKVNKYDPYLPEPLTPQKSFKHVPQLISMENDQK